MTGYNSSFLTPRQIKRYAARLRGGSLLTQAHASASPMLRKRLASVAAAVGRMEWLCVMEVSKTLNSFSQEDWATTVQLLSQAVDTEAFWKWLLKAPPIHSQTLLQRIPAGTPPPAQFAKGHLDFSARPGIYQLWQMKPNHVQITVPRTSRQTPIR